MPDEPGAQQLVHGARRPDVRVPHPFPAPPSARAGQSPRRSPPFAGRCASGTAGPKRTRLMPMRVHAAAAAKPASHHTPRPPKRAMGRPPRRRHSSTAAAAASRAGRVSASAIVPRGATSAGSVMAARTAGPTCGRSRAGSDGAVDALLEIDDAGSGSPRTTSGGSSPPSWSTTACRSTSAPPCSATPACRPPAATSRCSTTTSSPLPAVPRQPPPATPRRGVPADHRRGVDRVRGALRPGQGRTRWMRPPLQHSVLSRACLHPVPDAAGQPEDAAPSRRARDRLARPPVAR